MEFISDTRTQPVIASAVKLVGFILLSIILYLALLRVDIYLKDKAINDCGQISRFEKRISDQNITVYYPEPDVYKQCLNRIGVK